MSHPLRGDDLLNGIPAAERVFLKGTRPDLIPPTVCGRRTPFYNFSEGLPVNHTFKLSRRTTQISA